METGWEDAIHAAKEAGIPVIVADRKIAVDETEYVSWIGSDFEEEGRKAVTWLDQYLTEQGRENETIHIVLLEGTEGATAAIGRTNGILHGVEEHPNWTIVDRGCANFTQGEGQTYMENLLSEGTVKDIDVIISENDNMIFGAMKALDRNGKSYGPEGDIIMISFDALHESFENMMAGKLHATVECNPLLASTVETVIEELEAGRLVVDGDSVTGYLDNRRRNTAYYEVWNKLIDYRNTSENVLQISVVNFRDGGGCYVYDTDLTENGAFLGDIRPYDEVQNAIKDELIACEKIEPLEYNGRSDYYIPLNSSYNIPVAYIIVGISTENVRREQLTYLGYITIIVTSITVLFGVFMIWFMQHNVLGPLNAMSKAASSYSIAILRDGKESPISRMNIRTGDELERLCESMKKMEHDIIASSSQLAIADWNSNHDSMTQLYNKRHYKEQLKELQNDCTIGVIYFDIDNLKRMNDTFGHEKGDAVILKAAEFIRRYLTEQASGFRIGGDEFVMLIRDCTEEKVQELVSTMRGDEKGNLSDVTAEFYCRLAIGGAFRKTAETLEETIKRADDEMYKNKHSVRKA